MNNFFYTKPGSITAVKIRLKKSKSAGSDKLKIRRKVR